MTVSTRTFDYEFDGATYEGFVASPKDGPAPVVLVSHAWAGRGDFEDGKAKALAELGYTGVAIDLYGKGKRGTNTEECQALMTPLVEDRDALRLLLGENINIAKALPEADAQKAAAIGFCFGGLCVLNMARMGADLAGVVSFHGLLGEPGNHVEEIKTKILVLHGWDDPMATPADVMTFTEDMTKAKADWQLQGYGGTMHAFTNPNANDPDFGTVYNADADRRSWTAMKNFLAEIFG